MCMTTEESYIELRRKKPLLISHRHIPGNLF